MIDEPTKKLSEDQFLMLEYIARFTKMNKFQPDFKQIALFAGVSVVAVSKRLKTLEKHSWLKLKPAQPRCIDLNDVVFTEGFKTWKVEEVNEL